MLMKLKWNWIGSGLLKVGTNAVALFQKQPGRFPLWHLKDLDKERKTILPVGKAL